MNRNEQILSDVLAGIKYEAIGHAHGISRQRVHQIAKRGGVTEVASQAKVAQRPAKPPPERKGRDPVAFRAGVRLRVAQTHGITIEEFERLERVGALKAYNAQKGMAGTRRIPWELSLAEWWRIWEWSGHWEQRGRGRGKYVMSRPGDVGPYAAHNVRIVPFTENLQEAMELRLRRKKQIG